MRIVYLLVALGVALVFYLSWIPDPRMDKVWFVPHWLARWTDRRANGDLRTAIPFLFLGGTTGLWLSSTNARPGRWLLAFIGLTAIAILAEAGQLLLPRRYFNWRDILWGGAGAFAGLTFAYLIRLLVRQLK
ncbi:VanZ family protein [Larkinella ripae]